jgi:hypothetical protein
MPYAEKRGGKLTGHWYGEVALKGIPKFRRRFETRKVLIVGAACASLHILGGDAL